MVTRYDVPINDLIESVAEELKKDANIQPPEWAAFVKTGVHKERPPARKDWWHVRCAAVLLSVGKLGPVGVSKLRVKYGGRKNRGHKPDAFKKASGNIIRKALQQLEKAGLVAKGEKDVHKGRVLSGKGVSLIDGCAKGLFKKPKKAEAPVKEVKEEPKPQKSVEAPAEKEPKKAPEVKKEPEQEKTEKAEE